MSEREALEEVLPACYPWARRLALVLCRDRQEADDLVQDALVQAVRRPPTPLSPDALRAWLRTVMVRLYLRRRRRALREAKTLLRLRRERPPPDPGLSEPTEVVLAALQALAPRQRSCVVLRYLEDLPEEEVASLLGLRPGTVKAHLAQARERLRSLMGAPESRSAGEGSRL